MRLKIGADGKAAGFQKIEESPVSEGFYDACRQALERTTWRPGLDKQGQPLGTTITFECRFEILY